MSMAGVPPAAVQAAAGQGQSPAVTQQMLASLLSGAAPSPANSVPKPQTYQPQGMVSPWWKASARQLTFNPQEGRTTAQVPAGIGKGGPPPSGAPTPPAAYVPTIEEGGPGLTAEQRAEVAAEGGFGAGNELPESVPGGTVGSGKYAPILSAVQQQIKTDPTKAWNTWHDEFNKQGEQQGFMLQDLANAAFGGNLDAARNFVSWGYKPSNRYTPEQIKAMGGYSGPQR